MKPLSCVDGENRDVVHAGAPLFAVRQFEQNRHAAHCLRSIRDIWLSSRQRKPSNDWHTTGKENRSLGERNAVTVAIEATSDADTFGMVAAKTGMRCVHLFKGVDHRYRRECARRQPAARIRKQTSNSSEHHADCGEPNDQARSWQWSGGHLRRFIRSI